MFSKCRYSGRPLKWYYAHFWLQNLYYYNCYIFQRITVYNNGWQINDNFYLLKLKNVSCQNIKKTAPLFVFCRSNASQYFCLFFLCYSFVETIFKCNQSLYICYKINGYFKLQLFTYHLSSVAHNATLTHYSSVINIIII